MSVFEDNFKMLKELREEIFRIKIDENPSKTDYNNLRDRNASPASSTVLSRTDLTWSQVMQLIGLRYDGLALRKDSEYIEDGFYDMDQSMKIEYFTSKVNRIGLTNDGWFRILNIIDEGNTSNKIATVSSRDSYVSSDFKSLNEEDQINIILDYINDNKILNSVDYNTRRDKKKTPSLSYINSKFGGWKNITEMYTKKFKKGLG